MRFQRCLCRPTTSCPAGPQGRSRHSTANAQHGIYAASGTSSCMINVKRLRHVNLIIFISSYHQSSSLACPFLFVSLSSILRPQVDCVRARMASTVYLFLCIYSSFSLFYLLLLLFIANMYTCSLSCLSGGDVDKNREYIMKMICRERRGRWLHVQLSTVAIVNIVWVAYP